MKCYYRPSARLPTASNRSETCSADHRRDAPMHRPRSLPLSRFLSCAKKPRITETDVSPQPLAWLRLPMARSRRPRTGLFLVRRWLPVDHRNIARGTPPQRMRLWDQNPTGRRSDEPAIGSTTSVRSAMVRTFRAARTGFNTASGSSSDMFQAQPVGRFAYCCGVRFDRVWHFAS